MKIKFKILATLFTIVALLNSLLLFNVYAIDINDNYSGYEKTLDDDAVDTFANNSTDNEDNSISFNEDNIINDVITPNQATENNNIDNSPAITNNTLNNQVQSQEIDELTTPNSQVQNAIEPQEANQTSGVSSNQIFTNIPNVDDEEITAGDWNMSIDNETGKVSFGKDASDKSGLILYTGIAFVALSVAGAIFLIVDSIKDKQNQKKHVASRYNKTPQKSSNASKYETKSNIYEEVKNIPKNTRQNKEWDDFFKD